MSPLFKMLVLKHHGREQGGEGAEQGECWPSSSCSVSNMVCLCLDFQHGTGAKSSKGKSLKMEDDSAPPRLKTNVEEKIVLKVKD